MSESSVASVYSEARSEYTKQLCTFLVPAYFKFFLGLLDKAREASVAEPRKTLWQFQTLLNDIPEWNMEKVSHEIAALQSATGCDYLEDLLTAVFIAHTKVLTAIRITSKQKKVQITVPKVEHFLFKVLCESAKLLWGNTYLFTESATSMVKQQNYRSIEGLLGEGVIQAVRAMVPVKNILKDFVSTGDDETNEKGEDSDDDDAVEAAAAAEVPPAAAQQPPPVAVEVPPAAVAAELQQATAAAEVEATPSAPISANAQAILDALQAAPAAPAANPTIVVDTRSDARVGFTDFDTVFDTENPNKSDIVYEPKEGMGEEDDDDDDDEGLLEILDEQGSNLTTDDLVDLDGPAASKEEERDGDVLPITADEFDVLT